MQVKKKLPKWVLYWEKIKVKRLNKLLTNMNIIFKTIFPLYNNNRLKYKLYIPNTENKSIHKETLLFENNQKNKSLVKQSFFMAQ
jgi:hypothetical protein